MSDQTLRSALIKLAHAKPELREHLLPLVRTAAGVPGVPSLAALKRFVENAGGFFDVYQNYSGRGMFGKYSQVAFTTNISPYDSVGKKLMSKGLAVDNMGRDFVYYSRATK